MNPNDPYDYPTELNLRVIGREDTSLEGESLQTIVFRAALLHIPQLQEEHLTTRPSAGNNYASVVIRFTAINSDQLKALTRDLQALPQVILVL